MTVPQALMVLGATLIIFSLVLRYREGVSSKLQLSPVSSPVQRWESWKVSIWRAEFSRAWTPWGTCLFPSLD